MAALWTEVCLAYPALSAMEDGYEVYAVADASGGASKEAHERAMQRIIQAGVIPVTWEQVMYEWQRDWARVETADQLREVIAKHTGAFGQGVIYAKAMFGAQEGKPLRKAGLSGPEDDRSAKDEAVAPGGSLGATASVFSDPQSPPTAVSENPII